MFCLGTKKKPNYAFLALLHSTLFTKNGSQHIIKNLNTHMPGPTSGHEICCTIALNK